MSERGFGNSPLACAFPSLLHSQLRSGAATTSPRLSAQEVNVLQTQLLFGCRSKKTTENGRSSREMQRSEYAHGVLQVLSCPGSPADWGT